MKLQDTTDPKAQRVVRTLFTLSEEQRKAESATGGRTMFAQSDTQKSLELVTRFRIHLLGLYYSEVGPEWDSGGREESDFLHHIDLVCSGRRQVVHGGEVTELTPGWAWFLPGGTPVARRCRENSRLYFIKFRCEWLPGVDPLLDWPERRPIRLGRWKENEFRKLWEKEQNPDTQSLFRLQAQLYTWLANSLPNLEQIIFQHIATHGRFEPVFNLIESRLGADLRVEDLAATMHLSVHAFSMAFSRSVGFSPKVHLGRRLNQEAIRLLIQSTEPIKEVAAQLRFADEFYFSRFFRRMNGVPPAAYRQKFTAAIKR